MSQKFRQDVLGKEFYVELVDHMGDDLEPLRAARMSTDNPTGVDEAKDDSLRNRLWRDKHTSPWESNVAAFVMVVPMFVLRQIDRHRTMSVSETTIELIEEYDEFRQFSSRNEFSARYSEMPDLFYVPTAERYRRKGKANKQGSEDALEEMKQRSARELVVEHTKAARMAYQQLLDLGVASEIARVVLPMNQATKIRLQAALPNWFRFLQLRLASDVQEETRKYAEAIGSALQQLWPKCYETFTKYSLNSVTFGGEELEVLRHLAANGQPVVPSSIAATVVKKLGID